MDEPLAVLLVLPVLLFGAFLVDRTGGTALAQHALEAATADAADAAAQLLASSDTPAAQRQATQLAESVVAARAVAVCTGTPAVIDLSYEQTAGLVSVTAACSVRVAGGPPARVGAAAAASLRGPQ